MPPLTPYSGSFRCCPPAANPNYHPKPNISIEEQHLAAKISRAEQSGPSSITKNATIAEISSTGTLAILRKGTNSWTAFPGNENEIGNVPTCADEQGLIWLQDALAGKPKPTNTSLGIIYMLCGATQHSTVDAFDRTSPAVPIGPHYMIIWPFDSGRDGLSSTARDAGAWVMFDGTPYAHLHVCGTPWAGREYDPETTCAAWSMEYVSKQSGS